MNFRVLFLTFLVGLVLPFSARAQNWDQIIKTVASDRASGDQFGYSVGISGDYAVVGAYQEDENAAGGASLIDAGSAYIFKYNGTVWVQEAKLVASDRAADDNFGYSVAISGDYVVVGAYYEDHDAAGGAFANAAGSAYIFKRSGTSWSQEAKIVASDRATDDFFGYSVGISGDYVVVGAYFEDHDAAGGALATDAGSAYIFKRSGTTWSQEAKIVASDRAAFDRFGWSVAISGDYVVVGAYFEDHDVAGGAFADGAGSAYIFKRSGTSWSQEAKIVASDRGVSDGFGMSVGISGDYVVVGAPFEDRDAVGGATASLAGSAYIFKRNGTSWSQEAKIVASDRASGDFLGYSVAISGDYVVVGAYQDDHNAAGGALAANSGSAYVFKRSGTVWIQEAKIVSSDRAADDYFGWSVGISGNYVVVGAYAEDEDAAGGATTSVAGSTYFFQRTIGQNNALNFDGVDDKVAINHNALLDFGTSTDFTIETSLKLSRFHGNFAGIICKGTNSNPWTGYQLAIYNNKITVEIASNNGGVNVEGATTLGVDVWYHIAVVVTRATNNVKIYVNGVLDGERTDGTFGGNVNTSSTLVLGSERTGGSPHFFAGTLDEVRIWNTVRTVQQLNDNKYTELNAQPNLVALYHFNQGTANGNNAVVKALTDNSNNNLTGDVLSFALSGSTSNWVPGNADIVLPVELTHFTGRSTEGGNLLSWATASEVNNEGFEVERLTDAGQWSILGFVKGNNKATTYDFLDKNPLETSYYRLRQIDNGGKETVSKVISIQNKGSKGALLVYPNPVSQTLNLDTEGGHFEIFNFLGQAVQQGVVSKSIDVSALPQGSYVLKIGTQHVKFVKE